MNQPSPRIPAIRLAIGYGTIVAVLPYLTLKVLWVSGSMIGIPANSPAHDNGFVGPNIVTGSMDVVAILAALAFTHRWGRRLPAWLILPPIWIGTGLLVPAAIEVVNGAVAAAVTRGHAVSLAGGLVAPWTYVVVYTSFVVQGMLLTTAYVLYTRARWAGLFTGTGAAGPGPTHDLQTVLATAGAAIACAVAVAHLSMAFGTQGAFTDGYRDGWQYTARSGEVVNAAMAVLAAIGILAIIHRPAGRRRLPLWTAVALTWTGTGAMFGYALLTLVAVATRAAESGNVTPLNGLTQLAALLSGTIIGLAAAIGVGPTREYRAR